jgi:hypothetical protein
MKQENPIDAFYKEAPAGDFNHKMIAIHKAMNAEVQKQHATLRKIL